MSSEGSTLSEKDEVTYWGKIYDVNESKGAAEISTDSKNEGKTIDEKKVKIEVNGSVMMGWGLEPCAVSRFTMIEKTEEDAYYDEEDYDDEDDDDDEDYDDLPELDDNIGMFE